MALPKPDETNPSTDTQGGAVVGGDVHVGGDFVGHDQYKFSGSQVSVWTAGAVVSTLLWLVALYVLRAKVNTGIQGYQGSQPIYSQWDRFQGRMVRLGASVAIWAMPALLVLGVVGYWAMHRLWQ